MIKKMIHNSISEGDVYDDIYFAIEQEMEVLK